MLDQLLQIIQQSAGQAVIDNPDVPNEHNEPVMREAASSIQESMQQLVAQQGAGGLRTLFEGVKSGSTGNPAVMQVVNQFAGNIMNKFGIPASAATAVAGSVIPMVLGRILQRAQQPGEHGFDLGGLLGSILGGHAGRSGNIMDNLSAMGTKFGLDKNGDGKTDLSDLMKMFGK